MSSAEELFDLGRADVLDQPTTVSTTMGAHLTGTNSSRSRGQWNHRGEISART